MRKVFFIGCLLVLCLIFFIFVLFGFKLGPIKLMSYDEIEILNINKKVLLSELESKRNTEYENKEKELKEASLKYESVKSEFDRLSNRGVIDEQMIEEYINVYDFNDIWNTTSKYAKEKNVLIDLNVTKNNGEVSISPNYNIYDLRFSLLGDYINITDFIYSIEDDDKLDFEISDFKMESGENGINTTFIVKSIPISVNSIN